MHTSRLLLLALGLLGTVACSRGDAPRGETPQPPTPAPPVNPTPPSPPAPTPAPRPYTGYEGYTLLFDSGLARVLTAQPEDVGGAPHLYLLDREGKQAGEVLGDHLGAFEGREEICEGKLSVAGRYLVYLAKYDFSSRRQHQSRLLLIDRGTLQLVSNRLLRQPGRGGDEWVRESFTLADGSTYLSFDKRSYYRLPAEGEEMTKLTMPVAWARAGVAFEDKGYFFLDDDPSAYLFEAGATSPTKLDLFAGSSVRQVYPAGGEWLVLRDQQDRYQLFSMRTGQTVYRFRLSVAPGRSMAYDPTSQQLFFAGDKGGNSGSEAHERAVFVVLFPQEKLPAGQDVGTLTATFAYRLAGRTESDNRIGYQLQLGLQPDRRELLVSWLDQARSGTLLHPVTKVVALQLGEIPLVSATEYTLHGASDLRAIVALPRLP